MSNYKGLQNFFEEIPKELGYEYYPLNGDNSNVTTVLMRKLSKNFVLRWHIDNSLLFSQEIPNKDGERLKTLFFNRVFFKDQAEINFESMLVFISENLTKENPDAKILSLLEYIFEKTSFAGERISLDIGDFKYLDQYWRKMFFHTPSEFTFYIESAESFGFIEKQTRHQTGFSGIRLTTKGLKEIIDIERDKKSKTCFVAMSFDENLREIYDNAIVPALIETGFIPLRVDDDHTISSDVTINDAILAGIKKAKFTVADFTQHKKGVYFESGYALGQGQKVIYTCREDEISSAHFDTRNYPHIVWTDAVDLKKKLIDKIEVFIKA